MSRKELQAYGYPFHSLDERVERLKESILIIKGMWRESPFSFQGKYYKITRAVNLPKPKQSPHPPIWVGGKHPKILNVIAELADGWNSWGLGRGTLKRRNAYLSEKCNQFNRDPNLIVRSWLGTFEQITQNLKEEAQDLVNQTKYFIVSFDSSTTPKSYQSFVDLMNSLA
jgi:alkanesulfonate monooxygenase SsuD/methylene tetrahydromethanopterin reductase-like flavin-dependent oxidoreductase (luciferase family)